MTFDFARYVGAVTRTVTELEREGKPARNVTLERAYDTAPADLWDAVTNPERLPRWFLPVSGDLELNGRYQFEGNAGGEILECDPPHRLCVTWEFGGGTSWLELRISADGDAGARLSLSHICLVDDHWEKYGPGAVGIGWDLGLIGLAVYAAHEGAERFDEERFAGSVEGKGFIVRASQDWGRAAIAAGENPSLATAAAKLTASFYTGDDL